MGERTAIEWADSTLNLQMGCDGCELWAPAKGIRLCYAGLQTERMLQRGPRKGWPPAFDRPAIFLERLEAALAWRDLTGTKRPEKPWLDGLPRVVFLNDMGDGFTASLPLDWLAPALARIAASPHRYLMLTKRADRQADFAARHRLPGNVWCGVSITSAQDARIRALGHTRAAVRYVSYEPVLAPAAVAPWANAGILWAILGGASGDCAPPTEIDVLRQTVEACEAHGVAPFVKQLGRYPVLRAVAPGIRGPAAIEAQRRIDLEWPEGTRFGNPTGRPSLNGRVVILRDRKGGDWTEWPEAFQVRRMPR
jgi:protein gp37